MSNLENNTTKLQSILDTVNALPNASIGIAPLVSSISLNDTDYIVSDYIDTITVSYTESGNVVISAKTLNGAYAVINWALLTAPDGVSIESFGSPSYLGTSYKQGCSLQSCLLSGITEKCSVSLSITTSNAASSFCTVGVTVTYT